MHLGCLWLQGCPQCFSRQSHLVQGQVGNGLTNLAQFFIDALLLCQQCGIKPRVDLSQMAFGFWNPGLGIDGDIGQGIRKTFTVEKCNQLDTAFGL